MLTAHFPPPSLHLPLPLPSSPTLYSLYLSFSPSPSSLFSLVSLSLYLSFPPSPSSLFSPYISLPPSPSSPPSSLSPDDASADLSCRLVTDQFVLLQWSPPRLASRLNDDIIPDEGGQFNVMRYILLLNAETLDDNVPGNTMEYLYEVPRNGAGGVIFRLVLEYSDTQINDRLDRETSLPVTIPTAEGMSEIIVVRLVSCLLFIRCRVRNPSD